MTRLPVLRDEIVKKGLNDLRLTKASLQSIETPSYNDSRRLSSVKANGESTKNRVRDSISK